MPPDKEKLIPACENRSLILEIASQLKEISIVVVGDKRLGFRGIREQREIDRKEDFDRYENLNGRVDEVEHFATRQKTTNRIVTGMVAGFIALAGVIVTFWGKLIHFFSK